MQRLAGLNLTPRIDAAGIDQNPCTRPQATLYKETMTLGPLDPEELEVFKAQFGGLLAAPSSDERKIMLDRLSVYVIALRAIKHNLKNIKFRGLNPEDTELGFGFIRPMFTTNGPARTYRTNWLQNFAVPGTWYDWLHEGVAGTMTPTTLPNSFGLVITHLKDLETPTPFISECRFTIGRTGILIPSDVRALIVGDTENMTSIFPIPSMIIKPESTFLGRAMADFAGWDNVALGGLVIGLGRVLRHETGIAAAW